MHIERYIRRLSIKYTNKVTKFLSPYKEIDLSVCAKRAHVTSIKIGEFFVVRGTSGFVDGSLPTLQEDKGPIRFLPRPAGIISLLFHSSQLESEHRAAA